MRALPLATLAVALLLPLAASPVQAATVVAGTGTGGTFSFCFPTQVYVTLAGAQAQGSWTFHLTMLWPNGGGCAPLNQARYEGAWDPATGGCMAGIQPDFGQLCLGKVSLPGPAATEWWVCYFQGPGCIPFEASWVGTMTLAGA